LRHDGGELRASIVSWRALGPLHPARVGTPCDYLAAWRRLDL